MSREDERIARIAAILGIPRAQLDDAAVLAPPSTNLVLTVDEQVEGTHFTRDLLSLEDVGYRATMAAASDLAAMGATPLAALAAWVLPKDLAEDDADRIARGQAEACAALGASVLGGNLSRGPAISIATTWIGTAARPLARSGAKPGDALLVCGPLGLATAGFRALGRGLDTPDAAAAWRRPVARIADGSRMAALAHAAIDVSDGLAIDAGRLASASGVRAVLDETALRNSLHSATIAVARVIGVDPLDFALSGGEDYALLCASDVPIEGFVRVGSIEAGEGCVARGPRGERPVSGGFDHFDPQSP
ncbi:MAG TPA: thiamine-phosphate kinase [Polyangiaceae bacterium]|jgi:thiamine-monophosphate kinase